MNRLLLVPGILSCVGFIFLANTGSVETYGNPAKSFRSVSSAEPAARVLKSAEQIEEDLLAVEPLQRLQAILFSRLSSQALSNSRCPGE